MISQNKLILYRFFFKRKKTVKSVLGVFLETKHYAAQLLTKTLYFPIILTVSYSVGKDYTYSFCHVCFQFFVRNPLLMI